MIPDELVEQIRESADIVQIVGEYVNLKKSGADYRGPCPFHQGTHRNFSVSPRKRMFYCFVCHEGGDVFQFLQKRLGVEWPAAVRMVADKAGIEVREVDTRRQGPDTREPIWEVNGTASEYFQHVLWDEDLAADARAYLEQRDIDRKTAEQFGIGFAPREIGLLRSHMATLGFADARLVEAGLLMRPDDSTEPRPRFRGRLMFPIHDGGGHPVGFGGRLLGPGEPKYLNSADSPVFSKGKLLYGLNWSKNEIRREDRAFVVEGYFDYVRLYSAGIRTVVAPMGTALTEAQAILLRRFTANVYLLYDSDKAGLRATFRSGDELLRQKATVRVITLPQGEDPDSFVRAHGPAAFNAQVNGAIDVFDRKIQLLERAGWFADLHRKRRAIDRLLPTLRATADPLTRDLYLGRVSEVSGIDRLVLQRELGIHAGQAPRPAEVPAPPGTEAPRIRSRRSDRRKNTPTSAAERELLRVMLHFPAQVESIAERLPQEGFRDPVNRKIFQQLLIAGDEGIVSRADKLDDEAAQRVEELLADPNAVVNAARTVEDSILLLRVRELQQRQDEIDRMLRVASDKEQDALLLEKRRIEQEIVATRRGTFRGFSPARPS
jgi:DNA primase